MFMETIPWSVSTDLNFADDVSLMANNTNMLEIVVVSFEIPREESSQLGLEINCTRTKI